VYFEKENDFNQTRFNFVELTFLYSWWSDSNIRVFCDDKDLQYLRQEYSICLVNHRYEIDWLIGLVVSQKIGILGVCELIC